MWGKSAAVTAVAVLGLTGCNTDPMWEPEQSVDAPTVRIDRPGGVDVPDIQIAGAREVDLVESVLEYRALYHRSLTALRDYYRDHGYESKRVWAVNELKDVGRIKPYRYILSGEIPSDRLAPRDSIAEADALLERGRALMTEGGHELPILYRKNKMRQALATFRELIETYPSSDKIDDAAYFCGEIHKEYFSGDDLIAVRWFERAFTWNPETTHPARFRAAAVYDLRLHDRDRALELYRQVLDHETFNKSNVSFAVRRIEQLTSELEPTEVREPVKSAAFDGDDE